MTKPGGRMPPGERGTEGEERSDNADAAFAGS